MGYPNHMGIHHSFIITSLISPMPTLGSEKLFNFPKVTQTPAPPMNSKATAFIILTGSPPTTTSLSRSVLPKMVATGHTCLIRFNIQVMKQKWNIQVINYTSPVSRAPEPQRTMQIRNTTIIRESPVQHTTPECEPPRARTWFRYYIFFKIILWSSLKLFLENQALATLTRFSYTSSVM